MTLAHLRPGEVAIIQAVNTNGFLRQRLQDLGFLPGTPIQARFSSPSGDPVAYMVRGTVFALRRDTAAQVLVDPVGRASS